MKRLRSILFAIFLCSTTNAVDKTGTMAAKFLSTDIGSRAIGMGGAFTAIADDGSSMYWNPFTQYSLFGIMDAIFAGCLGTATTWLIYLKVYPLMQGH